MNETLDKKIEKAKQQIKKIISEYEKRAKQTTNFSLISYVTSLEEAFYGILNTDPIVLPSLEYLIETIEKNSSLHIELKTYILDTIERHVRLHIILGNPSRTEKNIQNLRKALEILANDKGLHKLNELYSYIVTGNLNLQNYFAYSDAQKYARIQSSILRYIFGPYKSEIEIKQAERGHARRKLAEHYIRIIIKGLLINPNKYERLYKQLIETNNLEGFIKYLDRIYYEVKRRKR
jgi:hypothetical protein